jgi:hypothetical protein
MRLSKINYESAAFFGIISLVMYLPLGLFMWGSRDVLAAQGISLTAIQVFLITPISWGVIGYLATLVAIAIYNLVSKKFAISWEVKK